MGSEEIIDCVEVELAEATLVIVNRIVDNQVLTNCSPETLLRKRLYTSVEGRIRCRHHFLSPATFDFFLVKLSCKFSAFTTKHIS